MKREEKQTLFGSKSLINEKIKTNGWKNLVKEINIFKQNGLIEEKKEKYELISLIIFV